MQQDKPEEPVILPEQPLEPFNPGNPPLPEPITDPDNPEPFNPGNPPLPGPSGLQR